jgi:hypothetical protein
VRSSSSSSWHSCVAMLGKACVAVASQQQQQQQKEKYLPKVVSGAHQRNSSSGSGRNTDARLRWRRWIRSTPLCMAAAAAHDGHGCLLHAAVFAYVLWHSHTGCEIHRNFALLVAVCALQARP